METKVCKICGIEKPTSEFYFRSDTQKFRNDCKECHLKQKKIYNEENSEYRKEYMRDYRIKNPNKHNEWRTENIEYVLNEIKKWKKENPEKAKLHKRNNAKKKLDTDSKHRLKVNVRRLIALTFTKKGYSKNTKTYNILGIDFKGFFEHIESQFLDGMNWDNRNEWEIDHIVPISIARNEEQIFKLNHYSNLRPLWRKDNQEKSNKILEEYRGLIYKLLGDDFVIE